MDREVRRLRDMLSAKLSELIYNGFWFSPEMDFLMAAIDKSQEVIDGKVRLKLYKGNVTVHWPGVDELPLRPGSSPAWTSRAGSIRPTRPASSRSTPSD